VNLIVINVLRLLF